MVSVMQVAIDGRTLELSNLDKVLYPTTGFTKGEVIDYYTRVAPTMLTHVRDRGITFRRYPNGTDESGFFEKRCPGHRPDWVPAVLGPGGGRSRTKSKAPPEPIHYCQLDSVPALVWAANLAALEIHSPMARSSDIETPTMVVFDLDPGPDTSIVECCDVALWIRDLLDGVGLNGYPKTSGSKGLQLYLPLNPSDDDPDPPTHDGCSSFALAVAQVLERKHPTAVTSEMAKAKRPGKVFIDWSQNSRHKTTIAPYSLRARPAPTVSTPVTWDEVAECAEGAALSFTAPEVLERIESLGDLFEPAATQVQHLPAPRG